jgi:phenylacetate-CoA ligase
MSKQNLTGGSGAHREGQPRRVAGLQLQRMKWSLKHAYDNVPHYRKKYDAAGVHPERPEAVVRSGEVSLHHQARPARYLSLWHVCDADARRGADPRFVGHHGQADGGGLYEKRHRDVGGPHGAFPARGGLFSADDIILNSYGYGLFTGGLGAHYGGEALGATVIPMSGGQTEKQVQLIQDFKPTVIMSTPSYVLTIADEMIKQGMKPTESSLRVGVFGAEPWTNEMRREIEERLGIDAVDIYGLSEVMGPGVSCECVETKDGPHIWEDHFYPEIINPETGEVLPDGELGELVFTSLSKEALPILRYRTRDLTRLLPGTARSMRRMEKITGRSDDMLIIRGVNVFPTQIEEVLLKNPSLCAQYQLQVSRDGHLDKLDVYVEVRADLSDKISAQQRKDIGAEVKHHIKSLVGVSADVHVVETDKVERTLVGKARRVIDRRPKQ